MLLFQSYVAPSSIEGAGVFTAESIAKGAMIWRADSRLDVLIDESELGNFPPQIVDFIMRYGYPSNTTPGKIVIEGDNGRFMNHSSEPNTDFNTPSVGYALRDIGPGEEITCNYKEFYAHYQLLPSVAA